MNSGFGAFQQWALHPSRFTDLPRNSPSGPPPAEPDSSSLKLVFRLRQWPNLPDPCKTAAVYQLLSIMSLRSVSLHWIRAHTHLEPGEIDALLHYLQARGLLEVIDISCFPPK